MKRKTKTFLTHLLTGRKKRFVKQDIIRIQKIYFYHYNKDYAVIFVKGGRGYISTENYEILKEKAR